LNRFGGDIYLGVLDDGTIVGVPEKAAGDLVKNFINTVSNPDAVNPTVYLTPKTLVVDEKTVIHIHIISLGNHWENRICLWDYWEILGKTKDKPLRTQCFQGF
jgi:predicted HTH transcriptional regulator